MAHDPHTKIPLRSQDCSRVSKPGHCEDNGHRTNSRFTLHKGDSSSVSRSIRTQMKTSDTGYNVRGDNVHVIQSYVKILDSTHQDMMDSPKHKFRYTMEYFDQDVTHQIRRTTGQKQMYPIYVYHCYLSSYKYWLRSEISYKVEVFSCQRQFPLTTYYFHAKFIVKIYL